MPGNAIGTGSSTVHACTVLMPWGNGEVAGMRSLIDRLIQIKHPKCYMPCPLVVQAACLLLEGHHTTLPAWQPQIPSQTFYPACHDGPSCMLFACRSQVQLMLLALLCTAGTVQPRQSQQLSQRCAATSKAKHSFQYGPQFSAYNTQLQQVTTPCEQQLWLHFCLKACSRSI